ncbi:hypothetical protein BH11PLA2_BH11PLA2_22810 [soil metagenome]
MPDLLHFGMDWLADKLRQHVSRTVMYRRGADEIAVPATIGRTLMKLADSEGGVRMEWTDRDFLIRADLLVIAGNRITPERGDRVIDDGKVYEVMAPGGEPPWRVSDPFGVMLRIHTKFVGNV